MKLRELGLTSEKFSEIGLGTWAIGGPYWTDGEPTGWSGPLNKKEIINSIKFAIANGVNHIDTADVYGYGKSERLIGEALEGFRQQVFVATKVGWAATTSYHVYDPFNIRKQCEQSLRNLKTDYIDLYYFHHCEFGESNEYLEDAINEFLKLKNEGKIRYIGLSGYSEEEFLSKAPIIKPDVLQVWADIEHDEFIREGNNVRKLIEENNFGVIIMMPFGQGRLLGKYNSKNPPQFGEGDTRSDNSGFTQESLKELEPRISLLKKRFGESTEDLARVALQFLLANPIVSAVIPGFRNIDQIKCNLKAAGKPFTKKDLEYIFEVFPRNLMPAHPWAE